MSFIKLGAEIFRDYQTTGVPSSGAQKVVKSDMRDWMAEVERQVGTANYLTTGWVTATAYAAGDIVWYNSVDYQCLVAHTSGASTEPGVGASWSTYWQAFAASLNPTGSVSTPGIAFGADPNTGFYRTTADTIDVALGGARAARFASSGLTLGVAGTLLGALVLSGSTSGTTTIQPAVAASGVLTLPAATDTLVGRATTDTLTNKTLTSPTINGGTHTAVTSFGLRNAGSGAYDVTVAVNETLTAARTLTVKMNDAARSIDLGGNLTLAGALTTSGAYGITLTATNTTALTLPTAGTLVARDSTDTLTNKTIASPIFTGTVDAQQAIKWSGYITPTALSGNVDNYAPTGFSTATVLRIDGGAADRDITGIAGGAAGRLVVIHNIGATNNLVLKNETTSTAANRLLMGADITIAVSQTAVMRYDDVSSRWRILAAPGTGGGGSGTVTSIAAGPGLTTGGGAITSSGTLSIDPSYLRGFLSGLTLSNNGTDATNDIDIAAGVAVDATNAKLIKLTSAITKRLDASWAVGSGNGGLDTGSIANTTYHIHLIMRSDTGVVDVLFSTSASSPTLPTNYDYSRRIGSIVRSGGAILAFHQFGERFLLDTPVLDVNITNPGTSAVTRTLSSIPTGIVVGALLTVRTYNSAATEGVYVSALASADLAPSTSAAPLQNVGNGSTSQIPFQDVDMVMTNTSAQIRTRNRTGNASTDLMIVTRGWVDGRGL